MTEPSAIQEKEPLQTVSKQDMTSGFQTFDKKETWLLNAKRIGKQTDVAACLMARDYKGFGNQQLGNGVIECIKNLRNNIHRGIRRFSKRNLSDC